MNDKKEAPASLAAARGLRQGERSSTHAFGAMTEQMLRVAQPLPHIRNQWATRVELALALGVHRDTVTRRCRLAGVTERVRLGDDNRAHVEYSVEDVRSKLFGGCDESTS